MNVLFKKANSYRLRVISESCALVGALLQKACCWDAFVKDGEPDDGSRYG